MRIIKVKQKNISDCAVASMLSIIKYYKGNISSETLRELTNTNKDGTSSYNIKKVFNNIGFVSEVYKIDSIDDIKEFPVIAHTINNETYHHYVVIYKIKNNIITVMDPKGEIIKYKKHEFENISSNIIITAKKIKDIPKLKPNEKIIHYFKKEFKTIKKIILISLLISILSIMYALVFKEIISNKKLTTVLLFIVTLRILLNYIRNKMLIKLSSNIDENLFKKTINHILSLPYMYFKNRTTGDIVSKIYDLNYIKDLISNVATSTFVDIIYMILLIITVFIIDKRVGIILTIILISIIMINLKDKKVTQKTDELFEKKAKLNSKTIETINSYETIKGLNIKDLYLKKLFFIYDEQKDKTIEIMNIYNKKEQLKEMIIYIGYVLVLIYSTKSSIITLILLYMMFIDPLKNIGEAIILFRNAKISYEKIEDLVNIKEEKRNLNSETINGDIEYKNFNYEDHNIKNINLKLKQNENVLITGKSGVGKSTIVKALMGYYIPNHNQLFIGNKDIKDYDLNTLRDNIKYVSQNEYLMCDTIKNNINIIKEDINEVISKTCLENIDINKFLEENGSNISGGQRQKIILAKALTSNYKILILDEATNQMDLKSERVILQNIINKNKTIIFITHRLDNKDLFDKVIKIEQGGISETTIN